jgi:peptide deformylase
MNRKNIITLPDKVLRETASIVTEINNDITKLAQDMTDATLDWEDHREHEVGVALAANQVGIAKRLIVIRDDYADKENRAFRVYVNPEIVKTDGEPINKHEGCLSIKDIYGLVPRYPRVKIKAQTLDGKTVRFSVKGFLARIFQHEIDHLNGKLFIDHVGDKQFFKIAKDGELTPITQRQIKHIK